jgi:hypothetical protein
MHIQPRPLCWLLIVVFTACSADSEALTFDLTRLEQLCVAVDPLPSSATNDLGLRAEAVLNYVYVTLKAKLPRLLIERLDQCGVSTLWITVRLYAGGTVGGRRTDYYGGVDLHVVRPTLWLSGKAGLGIAYFAGFTMTGPMDTTRRNLEEALEQLLTNLAAEYYAAGNP